MYFYPVHTLRPPKISPSPSHQVTEVAGDDGLQEKVAVPPRVDFV